MLSGNFDIRLEQITVSDMDNDGSESSIKVNYCGSILAISKQKDVVGSLSLFPLKIFKIGGEKAQRKTDLIASKKYLFSTYYLPGPPRKTTDKTEFRSSGDVYSSGMN